MENAADALKIAFGIFVFMLAFTVFFQNATLVRFVAESLIAESDKSNYYTYIPDDTTDVLSKDTNGVVNRIVTIEDMLPTIYRYSIESYGVTIIDKDWNIVTRFDKETEVMCSTFNNPRVTDNDKMKLVKEINAFVLEPTGMPDHKLLKDPADLKSLFERIYKQIKVTEDHSTYECPWHGRDAWIAQRIDSDMSRNSSKI